MYAIIVSIFTATDQISCYLDTFKIVFTILYCMYLDCMFEQFDELITNSYQLFFESLIIFLPEFSQIYYIIQQANVHYKVYLFGTGAFI